MLIKISSILNELETFAPISKKELEAFRIKYLSKSGELNKLFEEFKKTNIAPKPVSEKL